MENDIIDEGLGCFAMLPGLAVISIAIPFAAIAMGLFFGAPFGFAFLAIAIFAIGLKLLRAAAKLLKQEGR